MTPRRPASIPRASKWETLWKGAIKELGGEIQPTEAKLLERMVLNLLHAEASMAEAAKEPFVQGSQGQLVAHAGFAIAARCDERALTTARQLKLTPLARQSGRTDPDEAPADPFAQIRDELAERRVRQAG